MKLLENFEYHVILSHISIENIVVCGDFRQHRACSYKSENGNSKIQEHREVDLGMVSSSFACRMKCTVLMNEAGCCSMKTGGHCLWYTTPPSIYTESPEFSSTLCIARKGEIIYEIV